MQSSEKPFVSGKNNLFIKNARLIDGTDNQLQDGMSILIKNGRIAEIGKDIAANKMQQLDVHGAYVLPGIIDSHVHLSGGPGVLITSPEEPMNVEEWRKTRGKYILHYLRAYLACGVTTVLDANAATFVIQEIRRLLENNPGPRLLCLGQFFAPSKGYGVSKNNDPVTTPEEVEAKFDAMQALGVTGIKTSIERGFPPINKMPRHSPEILNAIMQGAARRNLPVYIHTTSEEDFNTALDIEAHALMHTLTIRTKELSESFAMRMAGTKTNQVTTLAILDSFLTEFYPNRLNEPLLDVVVPQSELLNARDPEMGRVIYKKFLKSGIPGLPKLVIDILIKLININKGYQKYLHVAKKAINDLHNAGATIVMGSDTVPLDSALYTFHGFTSLREIELLGEAGLSPKEAIKAATVNGAKMLGLEKETGTVEAGKCADLVILKENPLNDLRAFRTVQWTVKDGIAKTPKEWMIE